MNDNTREIFSAIKNGDAGRVRDLAEKDPTVAGARDENGVSVLMQACYHFRADMVEALLAANPAMDIFDAAAVGRTERVRELLAGDSAQAMSWSGDGFTALHLACFFGQPECARLLIEAGANANAESRNAAKLKPINSAAARRNREAMEALLDHGADIEAAQAGGYTALHSAAHNGDTELVKLLLKRGATPDPKADDGKTPPQMAEEAGHHEAAALLRDDKS